MCSVAVSICGNTVDVGDYGNDGNVSWSGHVRALENIDNSWVKYGDDIDREYSYY